MWLACLPVVAMATGLVVCVRGLELADGTRLGTIARLEAERAAESGALLSVLTAPWLLLAAVLIP